MKKFKFSLSEVLDMEEAKKNELLRTMGSIKAQIALTEASLREHREELDVHTRNLLGSDQPFTACYLNELIAYQDKMILKIEAIERRLLELEKKSAEISSLLLASDKRLKILEHLKEKQYADHTAKVDSYEEALIQELIETKYIHGRQPK